MNRIKIQDRKSGLKALANTGTQPYTSRGYDADLKYYGYEIEVYLKESDVEPLTEYLDVNKIEYELDYEIGNVPKLHAYGVDDEGLSCDPESEEAVSWTIRDVFQRWDFESLRDFKWQLDNMSNLRIVEGVRDSLMGVDFRPYRFSYSSRTGYGHSGISHRSIIECDLRGITFGTYIGEQYFEFQDCKFLGCDLRGATLARGLFRGCVFVSCLTEGATFSDGTPLPTGNFSIYRVPHPQYGGTMEFRTFD